MSLAVDIIKDLGNFQLNVKFEIGNDIIAFIGASGSGKSMTLKCIAGIEKPNYGTITLNEAILYDSKNHINLVPQKRMVGYLFQQYALFPNMTAEDNIKAGVRSGSKDEKNEIVHNIIKKMHLEGLEHKKPGTLSGGQQQRVALARILVNNPDVLMLDEPFSALDPYLRYNLSLEMKASLSELNKPIILVSHSIEEVKILAKYVAVIKNGQIEQFTTVDDLIDNPSSDYAAQLINPWGDFKIEKNKNN